ncbi:MAG: GTPase HflX [Deltaproteobacteria bacterium]|jgi:GTP-binding protein HflX|nr:GTPase HflX [Deltaproteobacteria bacterium]
MSIYDQTPKIPTAVLVGVKTPGLTDHELQSSLDELERLVTTLGYRVIGRLWQKRKSTNSAVVLGEGKLRELAKWTGGPGEVGPYVAKKKHKAALRKEKEDEEKRLEDEELAEELANHEAVDEDEVEELGPSHAPESANGAPVELAEHVVFDCELSPSQLRNLEKATSAKALDRTGVIIEIFSRHAKTRAAKLQVEIARLTYVAPRLRETSGDDDRGSAGGMGGKGAGESTLELDRRAIRDRIKALKDEFSAIDQEQDTRRSRRSQENTVALVGYTNAGKSSLMRALTGSDVYIADKLFATLDTTVRMLYPETTPRVLVSDTVGFIKKLPHNLVASFRSTLDEAGNASLLLFIVDAADPEFRSQLTVTQKVLEELGVKDVESFLILNKIDRVPAEEVVFLKREFPRAILLSALNPEHVAELRGTLIRHFEAKMRDEAVLVPYESQGIIGEIREKAKVLNESYDENGVTLRILAPAEFVDRIKAKIKRDYL